VSEAFIETNNRQLSIVNCQLDSYLYETHMHTAEVSDCASATAAEQVRFYKAKGYAGVIITDHFINGNSNCPRHLSWKGKMKHVASGYLAAAEEGAKRGLDVFFGIEYAIRGQEFLTYGIDLDFLLANPGLDKLTIGEYSALVREYGGYLAQAHPYREAYWIPNPFPVEPRFIDGVEGYNACDPEQTNHKARQFAALHKLPMQAGSDSHHINSGGLSGIKLPRKAESIFDIIAAIKSGSAELIEPD